MHIPKRVTGCHSVAAHAVLRLIFRPLEPGPDELPDWACTSLPAWSSAWQPLGLLEDPLRGPAPLPLAQYHSNRYPTLYIVLPPPTAFCCAWECCCACSSSCTRGTDTACRYIINVKDTSNLFFCLPFPLSCCVLTHRLTEVLYLSP